MMTIIRPAISLFILLMLITGIAYPVALTAIGQAFFSQKANGSLLSENGKVVGSQLIGQQFSDANYFWGRPSATTPAYNSVASSGSNLGPSNPALLDLVKQRVAAIQTAHPGNAQPIPTDLVTASGSGLDPDISIAAAYYQAPRVAQARNLPLENIHALIERLQHKPLSGLSVLSGLWGEPSINVLQLNLSLDGNIEWP